MVINVHDLIRIDSAEEIIFLIEKPFWVNQAIQKHPYVVVRRAEIENNLIPIGIRGSERHQRVSGFILKSVIKEIHTPEMIAKRLNEIDEHLVMRKILQKIDLIMKKLNLKWGVLGSVAYEIVTGKTTINEKSDIDIIIRNGIHKENFNRLAYQLKALPIRIDILIETVYGGYNLKEYLSKESSKLLMKTNYGPQLILKSKLDL